MTRQLLRFSSHKNIIVNHQTVINTINKDIGQEVSPIKRIHIFSFFLLSWFVFFERKKHHVELSIGGFSLVPFGSRNSDNFLFS